MTRQTSFDAFAGERKIRGEQANPWKFDEYGPTMDEPAHWRAPQEFETLPGTTVDQREIEGTGLATSDFTLINGQYSHELAADRGYHPDDEHRPERVDEWRETLAKIEDGNRRAQNEPAREVATDGGAVETDIPTADPANPPEDETVLLIRGITRVMHTPRTVEGTTSSTGKTISVELDDGQSYRLDASQIFAGESEFRDSRYFEIYTPARLRSNQRANKAPGPQAGADTVSDPDDLPEPTHWPTINEPDDAPDECPECGQTGAPWADKRAPVCEACGYMDEEDEEEADESGDDIEAPGYQDLERGDTLIIDGYRGEFVITRVHTMVGSDTTNYLEAARRDGGEWSEVVIQDGSPYDDRKLKINEDAEVSIGINVNDPELAQDYEVTGNDKERVRRYIRDKRDQ